MSPARWGTSTARAVSGDGKVVVGLGVTLAGSQAYRWSAARGMQSVGTLGIAGATRSGRRRTDFRSLAVRFGWLPACGAGRYCAGMEMAPTTVAALLVIGVAIGAVSGMVGIGGGILVIPVLMFFFGFSQAKANGTSMAMLMPPIGVFAVLVYHRAGNVEWRHAGLLAAGFAVGAYVGGRLLNEGLINPTALRVAFALLLVYCAGRLLFRPGGRAGAALMTTLMVVAFAATYAVMRVLGRRWKRAPDWGAICRARQREPYDFDYEI